MTVNWKFDRDDSVERVKKEAQDKAMKQLHVEVPRAVEALRCPVHDESPQVVQARISGTQLLTRISACCDEMLAHAQQVAGRPA